MHCLKTNHGKPTLVFLLAALLLLTGCEGNFPKDKELISKTGFYFDTVIQIELAHSQGETLLNECFSLCGEMEKIFSRTRKDSELYQVNHRDTDQMTVSDELAYVIRLGLEYGEKTEGAFDITIAPVMDLWDFKSKTPKIPDSDNLAAALTKVNYQNVHLSGNRLTFDRSDTMLDLGGIAKGYIADQIKIFLEKEGVDSAAINLGGNVQTIGRKPDGTVWKVGIQKPYADRGTILRYTDVEGRSVVSAGTYERYFEKDGKRYCHILDPHTGYPIETDLDQVTVVCDESALGDVLSTACLILGEEKGKALAESLEFSNTWLHPDYRCAMIIQ